MYLKENKCDKELIWHAITNVIIFYSLQGNTDAPDSNQ